MMIWMRRRCYIIQMNFAQRSLLCGKSMLVSQGYKWIGCKIGEEKESQVGEVTDHILNQSWQVVWSVCPRSAPPFTERGGILQYLSIGKSFSKTQAMVLHSSQREEKDRIKQISEQQQVAVHQTSSHQSLQLMMKVNFRTLKTFQREAILVTN